MASSTVTNGVDIAGRLAEPPTPTRCIKCTAQQYPNPSRNLVVCIDGTSNKFGRNNTNIVKLFSKINLNPERPLPQQRAYYSSGVGIRPKAWHVISRFQRSFSNLLDEAVAWNVEEIVHDAYYWLAREYREGDQIYLFGFSRGAYQVRILAGMIYEVGLIKTVTDKQIGMAYDRYMAIRSRKLHAKDIATDFKHTFCWENMKVHFVGVWDTVSSVGLVKEDVFLSSSSSTEHACYFRHALALDETRVKFMSEYFYEMNTVTDDKSAGSAWKSKYILDEELRVVDELSLTVTDDENLKATDDVKPHEAEVGTVRKAGGNSKASKTSNVKEVWFAGSHSDVGGRNLPGKSFHAGNVSLMWMRHEATESGLILKPTDMVWTPADLENGTSKSMSLAWKILELFPIKHQVSWCGPGEHVRKWHLSKPRRIIPGQKVHASVLFSNMYRPKAVLGEGFVFPAGWPSTSCDELDDEKWEKVLFDYTAVRELFGHLQSRQGVPLRYLDRLLFVLRFKEGRDCVRGVDEWQETFQRIIHGNSEGIVKLVAIVAYCEACVGQATPPKNVVDEITLSKDTAEEVSPAKDVVDKVSPAQDVVAEVSLLKHVVAEVSSSKDMVHKVTLSEDVLNVAWKCLQDVLSKRLDKNCRRVLALLRPLTDHEVLRQSLLTADVIKAFMGLLDDVLIRPGAEFGQVMDALDCLLKHDPKFPLFDGRRPLLMLAGTDQSRLTASLNVIILLARTDEGRSKCKVLKPRLRQLAEKYQGRVGLLAVEVLLELYDAEEGKTKEGQAALIKRLLNNNFRANLACVFNLLNVTDDRSPSGNRDGEAGNRALRELFGLGDGDLNNVHKILMHQLQLATAESDAPERTAATLTVLKLCEDPKLRAHLFGEHIIDAFIKQLKRRDSSLLGAHAITTCLQYDDANMKAAILSNQNVLKYIVAMLRSDSFDGAVGRVEGWRVFAKLMSRLMQDANLKRQIEANDSEIVKVLEEKLGRGMPKDIRTSLISLEILRSLGEHANSLDVWTKGLVGKGLEYLESKEWKSQQAGIAILSALAQTQHGVNAIMPHIENIVNMLLPGSHRPKEWSISTNAPEGSQLKPCSMMGPACALRVLSEDEKLRKTTSEIAQLESLKDLWLDGNLIEDETPPWRIKTPTRDDVLEMIEKMIKSVSGDFSEDIGVTSVGRLALPEIQHWARLAVLVRKSVAEVVAPPANAIVDVVRYMAQQLSPRQINHLLHRTSIQQVQS